METKSREEWNRGRIIRYVQYYGNGSPKNAIQALEIIPIPGCL